MTTAPTSETRFYLTRAEYDRLIETAPAFMAAVWPKLPKVWGVGGAFVTGAGGSGLAEKVAAIRAA